jgi:hypothetical protein
MVSPKLVINSIIATDISDKTLSAQRKARWNLAFHHHKDQVEETGNFSEGAFDESALVSVNRRATIVIEHIIQASDVAHCMQHW